jgi:hypothetical protein
MISGQLVLEADVLVGCGLSQAYVRPPYYRGITCGN